MDSSAPTLLLTGATGLVGRELFKRLRLARPDRRLLLLTRSARRLAPAAGSGIDVIEGDVRLPGFGVDEQRLRGIEESLTEIIHCAADTRFGLPLDEARAANVSGTENLLDVARRCRRLEKLAHVSTVYVAGRTAGRIAESYRVHDSGYMNSYQQSKHEAEERVVRSMSDIPAAIFRFSSLIGDSHSGRVEQFNYVHQLIKLLPRNVFAVAPGDPAAPVDLLPTDVAVETFAAIFESHFAAGGVHQICAGAERSLTVRQVVDRTVDGFQRHPKARRWLPLRVPELVPLDEYERYIRHRLDERDDALLRELVRVTNLFLPHLAIAQRFDNDSTRATIDACNAPPMPEVYDRIVAYCIETNWGG